MRETEKTLQWEEDPVGCRTRRGAGSSLPEKPQQRSPGALPAPPFHS